MYNITITDECIGCGFCSIKCPIQSIYGIRTNILNIVEEECIGCKICIFVCPVKCIKINTIKVDIKLNKFVIRQKILIKNSVFLNDLINKLHFSFSNSLYVYNNFFNYSKSMF